MDGAGGFRGRLKGLTEPSVERRGPNEGNAVTAAEQRPGQQT